MNELKTLSVLMPVYNEARTLRTIVDRVLKSPVALDIELICVDDGSTDSSWEVLGELAETDSRIRPIRHEINQGKGTAIRTAIAHMTGDIAIVQDADLEYDPAEFPIVLKPILDGRADAVYGSRFASSPERRVLMYWHSLGNKLLTWITNVLNDINLTDMETCYKAVRADVLGQLRLESTRFGIEPEITTRLAQWGARIYEVPISYHGRSYAEGKNIGWRDGVQALWLLFKYRFIDTRYSTREGHSTLESLRGAARLNRWVVRNFGGDLGRRVLDAGCGIGNIAEHMIDRDLLVAVDGDPFYVKVVERRFGHLENVVVASGSLEDDATYEGLDHHRLDSIVCVNVLEHLESPELALRGFHRVLEPGGSVLVLVPAHAWLFSAADEALEHHLRYDAATLRAQLEDAGFEVVRLEPFNRLGVAGWWINKQLGRTRVSRVQARLYMLLLPVAKLVERLGFLPGLSWVAVARKAG